jgi:casein kinase II subunit alpha
VHTGIALALSCLIVLDSGIANTNQTLDVKPDNILVNYGSGSCRFRKAELGDCGDTCLANPKDHLKLGETGHLIGAHMFRSSEAMLSLRWGSPTDIWSFGTTVVDLILHYFSLMAHLVSLTLLQLISLIWGLGRHIFKPDPKDAEPDDDAYPNHVLVKQIAYFGSVPLSYFNIPPEDDERWEYIGDATQYIIDNQKRNHFAMAEDKKLSEEDRTFIYKIMKLNPRDRPTAKELLQDPWLEDV